MDTLSYKTASANKTTLEKEWVIVDAQGEILGRLASKVAKLLRGKYKPSFTPHIDCGDNVIIINASKVRLTGNKLTEKEYISHSGYPGGQKVATAEELIAKKPTEVIRKAVSGMLPKNKLSNTILKNLHIFEGEEHTHKAQKPKEIKLNSIK